MGKAEEAVAYKNNGYNCCQSVIKAFAEEAGLSDDMVRKLGAGFAGGMGGMEGTCGALCGAQMVLGIMTYEGRPIGKKARALHDGFREACGGASICKVLKGRETGVELCSCDDCVKNAAKVLEELLF